MSRGNYLIGRGLRTKWGRILALALAAGAMLTASPVMAGEGERRYGDHGPDRNIESLRDREQYGPDRRDYRGKRDDDKPRIGFELKTGDLRFGAGRWDEPRYETRRVKVWVPPVYRTVVDKVWVEPEYRTVVDRVWVKPVVKHEHERVWVPARYEWRTVTRRDHRGRIVRVKERVCVAPGHFDERHRDVVVAPGHWETIERKELVCAGQWKTVERQELVAAGHYEWRAERVKVDDGRRNQTIVKFDLD